MSGHSKWSTIKRQKAVTDARRSAVFTKLGRLISVAARAGGADPVMNFRLRLAIDKARAANMPNHNIERAIEAGAGSGKEGQTKEVVYEGFGPGQVAIMVQAITDNSNRTSAEVRSVFTKHGGSMGGQNSVGWMFAPKGVARISSSALAGKSTDEFELAMIDQGADDVRHEDDTLVVTTPPEKLSPLQEYLRGQNISAEAEVELVPTTTVEVDERTQEKVYELLGALDELDDVTSVVSNDA